MCELIGGETFPKKVVKKKKKPFINILRICDHVLSSAFLDNAVGRAMTCGTRRVGAEFLMTHRIVVVYII